ncbi:MAG TPA: EAL domain-containing protein [Solimonas sp.]|nr:EAL domain-containing protein [Solimonas sp.]
MRDDDVTFPSIRESTVTLEALLSDPEARTLHLRLQDALLEQRLQVVFQPIFDIRSLRLHSAEALVRWCDAQLGEVGPSRFIPLAEHSSMIFHIGQQVLRQVLQCMSGWRAAGLPLVPVAINVSGAELKHEGFADRFATLLQASDIPGELIQAEVTEHSLISDFALAAANLRSAGKLGISFALDDFGTGHSSFKYLRHLPIRHLKIDREFVAGVDVDRRDQRIVRAMVALAHSLGIKVIAEGVETEAELVMLRRLKCDYVQGFLTGRPMPEERFAELLARSAEASATAAT